MARFGGVKRDGEAELALIYQTEREQANRSYADYCEIVNIQPDGKMGWVRLNHLNFVCGAVQEFLEEKTDNPYDILIFHQPPQTGKSYTITETLPSWYLGRNPDENVIVISYNEEFSQKFGRKNLEKVEKFGKRLFDIELSKKKKSNDTWELADHKGGCVSRGIGAGITGNPAKLVIIDDPIRNREEADSRNSRDKVWAEWKDSVRTRLAPGAKVIVIMTRWHEDDLSGRLLETEPSARYLRIPLECDDEESDVLHRKIGESIVFDPKDMPKLKDRPEIDRGFSWKEKLKRTVLADDGVRTWNALYQGLPSSEKGNIIKREWWRYYTELPRIDLWVMSVDCAFKGKESSDKVAITVWGKTGSEVYLIDAVNEQMGFNDTVKAIRNMKNKYNQITMILIEDKANGSAVIETLRTEIMGVIPIEPKGGKEARVAAVTPYIESGNIILPKFSSFTDEFVDQCSSFPRGKNDDLVDSMSQALLRLKDYKAHPPKQAERSFNFKFENPDGGNQHKLFGFGVPKSFFKF